MTLSTDPRAALLGDERLLFASDAVRAVDDIHNAAVRSRASDIHVEPTPSGGRIRARVDGHLHELRRMPAELFGSVVARLKVLAGMDVADRRQPQDGRYFFDVDSASIDARASSLPTIAGEKLVIRLLDLHGKQPSLDGLGMEPALLERYRMLLRASHGFIVICGPTGSGKTTTAYASIAERNVVGQHICTIEDPVEVRVHGVSQVQVNVKAGVSFASALRSFLRADPNVIMIGEMRDAETASGAISAALSGRLVLTTLHSGNAAGAIERLAELGVRRGAIAAGLSCIVGQRLVHARCMECDGGRRADCEICGGTGFAGRIGVFEMMVVDDALRQAISQGVQPQVLAEIAARNGFVRMCPDEGAST